MNLQGQISRIQSMMGLLVEGKQVGLLYHSTNPENTIKIIQDNEIQKFLNTDHMLTDYRNDPDDFIWLMGRFPVHKDLQNFKGFVSFTRNKNYKRHDTENNVQFVLDGDKLSEKYKIIPYSHFGGRGEYDEMEERIYDSIINLDKYVIDINYTGDNLEVQEMIDNYLNR
jgi:hypothetical protein